MFFGITMTPAGWFIAFFAAVMLMIAPLLVVESFAETLPEPMNMIATVVSTYILWPFFVAWLYKAKLRQSGRGSIIFYFYVSFYILFFVLFLSRIFSGDAKWDDYLGVVVLGAVSLGLIMFARKTNSQLNKDVEDYQNASYQAQREDDIQKQAEAILLAEKMKKAEEK